MLIFSDLQKSYYTPSIVLLYWGYNKDIPGDSLLRATQIIRDSTSFFSADAVRLPKEGGTTDL